MGTVYSIIVKSNKCSILLGVPVGGAALSQLWVRCSDSNVICTSRKVQQGEPHDIFIKVSEQRSYITCTNYWTDSNLAFKIIYSFIYIYIYIIYIPLPSHIININMIYCHYVKLVYSIQGLKASVERAFYNWCTIIK